MTLGSLLKAALYDYGTKILTRKDQWPISSLRTPKGSFEQSAFSGPTYVINFRVLRTKASPWQCSERQTYQNVTTHGKTDMQKSTIHAQVEVRNFFFIGDYMS